MEENESDLKKFREVIPKNCFEQAWLYSLFTALRILLTISFFLFLESKLGADSLENVMILIPLWFFHGQALVGLFVLAHDCGHHSFSKIPWINTVCGHLAFAPLANGFESWKETHNHHHAHTQKKGQEIDWSSWLLTEEDFKKTSWNINFFTRLGYALPFGILFWVYINAFRRAFSESTLKTKLSNLFMWLIMFVIYGGLCWKFGLSGMLKYHGIPAFVAMITGYILLIIQHANHETKWFTEESWTPVKGQLEATFDVRFPRLFEWLWLDINIHIPHHMAPRIPWYHLREASAAIKHKYPKVYQERKFSLKELDWMIKTPFLIYIPHEKYFKLKEKRSL